MEPKLRIENLANLSEAVKMITEVAGKPTGWFRGEPQERDALGPWELRPVVYRPVKGPNGAPRYYTHADEQSMTTMFRTQLPPRYADCPGSKELGKWLVLMRHYGLPTRLLDWTESILVAAYFAVENGYPEEQPGVIWGLRPALLNHIQGVRKIPVLEMPRSEGQPLGILTEAYVGDAEATGVYAVIGHEMHVRMMVQHSRFTIHATDKPLDNLLPTGPETPNISDILMRFVIPPTSKAFLRGQLFDVGIRRSTLFPEPDSLAHDIQVRIVPGATQSGL